LFTGVLLGFIGFVPSVCLAQSESTLVSTNSGVPAPIGAGLDGPNAPGVSAVSSAAVAAVPEPGAVPPAPGTSREARVGIGVKISTLGIGGEVAVRVLRRANVRGGFNALGFSHSFSANNGIDYSGSLHLRSAEAHFDYFLFRSFHISPGVVLYNGNNLTANAFLPGGQTFTAGGTEYESSSANPINAQFTANVNRVAPEILLGVGNLVPRGHRHWSINAEFGVDYEGAPKIAFGVTGFACMPPSTSGPTCVNAATDPTVQSNVAAQQATYNHDVSTKFYYRLWPVLSTGFSYSF
jgi:hypothetical protein